MGRTSKIQKEIDPQLYTTVHQWQRDALGLYGAELIVYSWLWTKTQGEVIDMRGITAEQAGCLAGIDRETAQAILNRMDKAEPPLAMKITLNTRRNTYLAVKPKDLDVSGRYQRFDIEGLYINQGLRTTPEVIVYSYVHSFTVNGKQKGFYGGADDRDLLKWLYGDRAVRDAEKLMVKGDPAGEKALDNMARTVRRVLHDLTERGLLRCNDKNKRHRIYKTTLGAAQIRTAKFADVEAGRKVAHAKVDAEYDEIRRQRQYPDAGAEIQNDGGNDND